MVILGLTGSIAMGKSTAAVMFRRLGVPIFDADLEVHRLLAKGGEAVGPVGAAFDGVVRDGAVDRDILGKRVFGNADALRVLEGILHPLVRRQKHRFLVRAALRKERVAVLDIPLLFETSYEKACDAVAVVSAPAFLQIQRLMLRPGMTLERAHWIRDHQMSDREKRRRADFVIPTGLGRAVTMREITHIVDVARRMPATHWPPHPGFDTHADRAYQRTCVRLFSIRKPRVSIPTTVTGSSKSAASSFLITSPPAARSSAISIP